MNGQVKKLTATEVKLDKVGAKVRGQFLEMRTVETVDSETGLVKPQSKVFLTDENGSRLYIWGNAGLKTAIEDSCLSKGDLIEIVKLEKKQLKGGRTKNQYDIFQVLN